MAQYQTNHNAYNNNKKKWLNDSDYYIFQLHDSSVNLFLINKICCPNSKSNDVKILVKLKPGIH